MAVTRRIPDGHQCPTFIGLRILSSEIVVKSRGNCDIVRGFDIGTGANCIYPLLGASLLGWSFVGTDMTDVAREWAEKNVRDNPHISELIEIRKVESREYTLPTEGSNNEALVSSKSEIDLTEDLAREENARLNTGYYGPPILLGVVRDDEEFDFCMCNPPFFETMEEAGLNPKTSCRGAPAEMICPGGKKAYITRIVEDSIMLKDIFQWYTSMLGKKIKSQITNFKALGSWSHCSQDN